MLIAQISDLHLVPTGTLCFGRVDTNDFARRAVTAVNRLKPRPDAILVTVDIIDTARAEDYAVAKEILGNLEAPYFLAAGNHDLSSGLAKTFPIPASSSPAPPGCYRYAVDIGSIRLVTLDSSVPGVPHGALSAEQLGFLDGELARAGDRPALIVVHHPPLRTGNPTMDRFALAEPEALAEVISQHDNVLSILCGHYHHTVFGAFAGTTVAIAPATGHQLQLSNHRETFGYSLEPPGYLLHRWSANDGLVTMLETVDQYPGPMTIVVP
jgi:Icc protein